MTYVVELTARARPMLVRLARGDKQSYDRIESKIDALAEDPRPHGVKPLPGQPGEFRVRVGAYRVVYAVRDAELVVLVVEIGHRSSVYDR